MSELLRFSPEQNSIKTNFEKVAKIDTSVEVIHQSSQLEGDESSKIEREHTVSEEMAELEKDTETVEAEENTEEETSPKYANTLRKFVVLYDGILSAEMIWDEKLISDFIEMAELESTVIIERGKNVSKPDDYESLGTTMIWKKLGNISDLFSELLSASNMVEVVIMGREARIKIHDQEIAFAVRERNLLEKNLLKNLMKNCA